MTTPKLPEHPLAETIFHIENEGYLWLAANRGRYKARKHLGEALIALSEDCSAGLMYVSKDYSVHPISGGVSGTFVRKVELDPEEQDKLILLCTQYALEKAREYLWFASESIDTGRAESAVDKLCNEMEERIG